jgi:hypothetical protein
VWVPDQATEELEFALEPYALLLPLVHDDQ